MKIINSYEDEIVSEGRWGELREKYNQTGFVAFDSGVTESTINQAVEHIKSEISGAGRRQDTWRKCDAIRRIAMNEKIHEVLFELHGRAPTPFQTLIFHKGTAQPAHGDAHVHFDSWPVRGQIAGVWIALQEIDESCGPLFYIEGSHKLPVVNVDDLGVPLRESSNQFYEDAIARMITNDGLAQHKRQFTCKKGFCGIWHGNLLHGGSLIDNVESTRFSVVVHHTFSDQIYTPMLSDHRIGKIAMRNLDALRIS